MHARSASYLKFTVISIIPRDKKRPFDNSTVRPNFAAVQLQINFAKLIGLIKWAFQIRNKVQPNLVNLRKKMFVIEIKSYQILCKNWTKRIQICLLSLIIKLLRIVSLYICRSLWFVIEYAYLIMTMRSFCTKLWTNDFAFLQNIVFMRKVGMFLSNENNR